MQDFYHRYKKWVWLAAVVLAILIVVIVLVCCQHKKPAQSDQMLAVVSELALLSVDNTSGVYVEDGSDDAVDSVMTATFQNMSDQTLQLADVTLTIRGDDYHFRLTTIPAHATVCAQESERKNLRADSKSCKMTLEHAAWFQEKPSMHEELFAVDVEDGVIAVTNRSGQSINGEVCIYYKNLVDGVYIGGITYRATIAGGLPSGASEQLYAPHFTRGSSELMFVTYVP